MDPHRLKVFYQTDAWKRMRRARMRKDRYRCQRCSEHFPYGQRLTVHHIKPLVEGGTNFQQNLMSLCGPCHDLIEGRGLTRELIKLSGVIYNSLYTLERDFIDAEEVHDWREIDWRIRVYGGVKNFKVAKAIMQDMQRQKKVALQG